MSNKYKTTRMFAVQAENFDGFYGPRTKLTRFQKIVRGILITPGVLLFLLPSFKLGLQHQRPPAFEVPDKVTKGSVFTVPIDESLEAITLAGETLPAIKGPKRALLAVAKSEPVMDLVLIYKHPERKWNAERLKPKFEHPTFEVYSKQIIVEPAPPPPELPKTKKPTTPPTKHELDAAVMARHDGLAQASCWSEPKTNVLPQKGTRDWRKLPVQYANLTAMAPGEVVKVEALKGGSKNIVVYHGGGLFTRYLELRDSLVRKGDKVLAGQEVGMLSLGTWKTPIKPRWDIFLGTTELNPPDFLSLSTQLCDSK
ncbi:MAG: M23 family metallopeptidase [Bdellovibrionota bacterium]